jgi:hypothetical protein
MQTFIAVCMGLLVLEIGLILAAVVFLVLRVKKTVEAVEVLAYTVEDKFLSVRSGWMRALQGAASLVGGFWGARRS